MLATWSLWMFNFWESQILDLPNGAHKPYLSWPLSRCVYMYVKCLQYRRLLVRIRCFLLLSLFVLIQESKLPVIRFQGFCNNSWNYVQTFVHWDVFPGEKLPQAWEALQIALLLRLFLFCHNAVGLALTLSLRAASLALTSLWRFPSSVGELTVQHEPSQTHSFYADIPRHSAPIPWHTMSTQSLNWCNLLLVLLYTWGNFQERSMHLKLND